ncbi:MAG: sigma-54-dependent Fis family transcriptional regulator, partial [Acidobacteria bacterium]|nr:sigma-54-dependent Fis family transcriptional regulator [Acidobacteriota bacterium]
MIEVVSRPKRILGSSPQIQSIQKLVDQAAFSATPILIYGERGSGREFVAEILHETGPRRSGPLEKLNCAGWNENLIERELAQRFERAKSGTVFLDDIQTLRDSTLARVLRYIDENRFDSVSSDARLIAACESGSEVNEHFIQFGIRITLPPLRDRQIDIPILVDHFIERFAIEFGKTVRGIHPVALRRLMAYPWPGNVRELRNAVERAVILAGSETLDIKDFSFLAIDEERPIQFAIPGATIQEIEKEAILRTLEHVGGSTSMAAKILNMSVRKIQYKLKEYRQAAQ